MWAVGLIALVLFIMNPRAFMRVLFALICSAVFLYISGNGWVALAVFIIMAIPLSSQK